MMAAPKRVLTKTPRHEATKSESSHDFVSVVSSWFKTSEYDSVTQRSPSGGERGHHLWTRVEFSLARDQRSSTDRERRQRELHRRRDSSATAATRRLPLRT